MKQYLLSMYQPAGPIPPPPVLRQELAAQNAWVFGQGLHAPETATVLRAQGDDVIVTDGPFAEGKEYLGGVTIIKAPVRDAALPWPRRYAEITGLTMEVRPFQGDAEA